VLFSYQHSYTTIALQLRFTILLDNPRYTEAMADPFYLYNNFTSTYLSTDSTSSDLLGASEDLLIRTSFTRTDVDTEFVKICANTVSPIYCLDLNGDEMKTPCLLESDDDSRSQRWSMNNYMQGGSISLSSQGWGPEMPLSVGSDRVVQLGHLGEWGSVWTIELVRICPGACVSLTRSRTKASPVGHRSQSKQSRGFKRRRCIAHAYQDSLAPAFHIDDSANTPSNHTTSDIPRTQYSCQSRHWGRRRHHGNCTGCARHQPAILEA